jgi:hypothetical protein
MDFLGHGRCGTRCSRSGFHSKCISIGCFRPKTLLSGSPARLSRQLRFRSELSAALAESVACAIEWQRHIALPRKRRVILRFPARSHRFVSYPETRRCQEIRASHFRCSGQRPLASTKFLTTENAEAKAVAPLVNRWADTQETSNIQFEDYANRAKGR